MLTAFEIGSLIVFDGRVLGVDDVDRHAVIGFDEAGRLAAFANLYVSQS